MKRYDGGQSPRRSWHHLVFDILKAARPGATKTRISYDTRLNWKQVAHHLPKLIDLDFIVQRGKRYFTTFQGEVFIVRFEDLMRTMDGPPLAGGINDKVEMEI